MLKQFDSAERWATTHGLVANQGQYAEKAWSSTASDITEELVLSQIRQQNMAPRQLTLVWRYGHHTQTRVIKVDNDQRMGEAGPSTVTHTTPMPNIGAAQQGAHTGMWGNNPMANSQSNWANAPEETAGRENPPEPNAPTDGDATRV